MTGIEAGLDRRTIIKELTRSPHGKLDDYLPVGRRAAQQDPEFYAHLTAWNNLAGQVRDAKVALPVVALTSPTLEPEFRENALAHLASQSPRELLKGVRFARPLTKGHGRAVRRMVERYLRVREANWSWWERTAIQHRAVLKELYALNHTKPNSMAEAVLFGGEAPPGSLFAIVRGLKDMPVVEAATQILKRKIPFLIAAGALGKRMQEPDLVLALIEGMTPTELVTNSKMLEKLGVRTLPALRGAYAAALERAAKSKKAVFKTDKAVEAVEDEGLKEKLRAVQEKQIKNIGVEGDWLVLGDKSGSMERAIEASRRIAATLATVVKGRVLLVFFDVMPRALDVTGKDYDAILRETRHVKADGGTSIGCGLQYALEKGFEPDGIAVVSDGEENRNPSFAAVYKQTAEQWGKEVPVYWYELSGQGQVDAATRRKTFPLMMDRIGQELQHFDLKGAEVDWVSLPNLVQTMRAARYSLVDEVMGTPLLTLDEVFKPRSAA